MEHGRLLLLNPQKGYDILGPVAVLGTLFTIPIFFRFLGFSNELFADLTL